MKKKLRGTVKILNFEQSFDIEDNGTIENKNKNLSELFF